MPELPEVERARALIEERAVGRTIARRRRHGRLGVPPARVRARSPDAIGGATILAARRRGKAMWLELEDGPPLGLHLGMAGRIMIDGRVGSAAGTGSRWVRRRRVAGAARQAAARPRGDRPRPGPARSRRRRDRAERVPRARRARDGAAQGADHGPGDARRRRQPAGRRDALAAGLSPLREAGGCAGRARPPAPRPARRHPAGDPAGRRAHGRADPPPPPRRHLPALRGGARAGDGRRAHDLVVPARPPA